MAAAPPPHADGRLFSFAGRPLIADGAMGTDLLARSAVPAALNLTDPDSVLHLHAAYVAAGARLLVTNTLGATREQLGTDAAGTAKAGVRLAREAVAAGDASLDAQHDGWRQEVVVAASLAVTLSREAASYLDQVAAMAEADLLLLETVTSWRALDDALEIVGGAWHKPIAVTVSFDAGRRLEGLTPAEVGRRLSGRVAAIGYGCGFGPRASLPILAELRAAAPNAVLIAKPSLGLPPYDVSPDELGAWALEVASLGADVIGACCGSTPTHIQAMAAI